MNFDPKKNRIIDVEVADGHLPTVVGRHHVSEDAWDILLDLFPQSNRAKGYRASFVKNALPTVPARILFLIWCQIWNEVQTNREIYRQVMRGGQW